MRLRYYLSLLSMLFVIAVVAVSCDTRPSDTAPPTDNTENTETDEGKKNDGTTAPSDENNATKTFTFIGGESSLGCYIVYGSADEYSTALAIRSLIKDKLGATVTANVYNLYAGGDIPELIIGYTDRESANAKISECIRDIGIGSEYFLFAQCENDLIFYASSDYAYRKGVEKFPDIFIKDGSFSSTAGYKYIQLL